MPRAADGTHWLWRSQREGEPPMAWRVDANTIDFSHILLQVTADLGRSALAPAPALQAAIA